MASIVVVGSATIDLVTHCARLPVPSEAVAGSRFDQQFGGGGANAAAQAALLGSSVSLVARLGRDALGESAIGNLEAVGVDASSARTSSAAATGVAQVLVDGSGASSAVVVAGANALLAPGDLPDGRAARVVVAYGSSPRAVVREVLRRARGSGAKTLYVDDGGGAPADIYALCDVVFVAEDAAAGGALAGGAGAAIVGACERIFATAAGESTPISLPPGVAALPRVDATGAVDAAVGAAAAFLAAGAALVDAAAAAAEASARGAARRGGMASYPALGDLSPAARALAAATPAAAPSPPPRPGGGGPRRSASATALASAACACEAVDEYVEAGMILGIGTGATVNLCIARIAERLRDGSLEDVLCLPTSDATAKILALADVPCLRPDADVAVDLHLGGCDAVDGDANVVKGGKGALLREKVALTAAKRWLVLCDEGKVCGRVGATYPIPVEVAPRSHVGTLRRLAALPSLPGADARLRRGDAPSGLPGCAPAADAAPPYETENGNFVADLFLDAPIADVAAAANEISRTPGVVEHGLFYAGTAVGTSVILVGQPDGSVRRL